jgi:uncharacterized beta barrel domain-containing protein DUF5777
VIRLFAFIVALLTLAPVAARAQAPSDDPAALKLAVPDFTLIGLPTTLRLPRFGSSFRVTHRFTRPLNDNFSDVLDDFFGIDSGAQIGLEYRFGIISNGQIGIHRTSNRTIEFFGEYAALRQGHGSPLDVTALATIEGTNNFHDDKSGGVFSSDSPALGAIVSRTIGEVAAFYVEPIWVNNTNPDPSQLADHNDTFMVGLGARIRFRPSLYLVGEFAPRASGYKPGENHGSFGIEKRVGGHLFQLNFSNAFGTTMAQIARGGSSENNWSLGFNISRKFF